MVEPETYHNQDRLWSRGPSIDIFLIATEPLNHLFARAFMELMYTTKVGVLVGPMLYADDNLTPLALTDASQLCPILSLYREYKGVRGQSNYPFLG
jgi:hypothetical protein